MTQFYETTVLLDLFPSVAIDERQWGIQILASPHETGGTAINYAPLINLILEQSALTPFPVLDDLSLSVALTSLADPEWNLGLQRLGQLAFTEPTIRDRELSLQVGGYLLDNAPIAAETSPLRAQTLRRLAGNGAIVTYLTITGQPALMIAGGIAGLLVLRGLGAVGGALWRGAEPNVERFGELASAKLLNALAKRLNL